MKCEVLIAPHKKVCGGFFVSVKSVSVIACNTASGSAQGIVVSGYLGFGVPL